MQLRPGSADAYRVYARAPIVGSIRIELVMPVMPSPNIYSPLRKYPFTRRHVNPLAQLWLLTCLGTWVLAANLSMAENIFEEPRLPGLVQAKQAITVFPSTTGQISRLAVSDGQHVSKHELLLQLDDSLGQAAVEAARLAASSTGQLRFAEAELQMAKESLARIESVGQHHAIAAREVDAARAAVEKASANLVVTREELALAQLRYQTEQVRLEQYAVTAPFAGQVTQVRVVEGQKVTEEAPLMMLVNLDTLTVELQVPLTALPYLHVNQICNLVPEAPMSGEITARLMAISPVLDAGTQTARCVLAIDNTDRRLPAGFLVNGPDWWYEPAKQPESDSASDHALSPAESISITHPFSPVVSWFSSLASLSNADPIYGSLAILSQH
ncbi:MAG: efflux RND transporter periplasmic adaptor subunit [Planctomycetales bacterium]|nr:efflux RND transporter periplasmic adaptor subunit [Planctomycetales bacterium]